MDVSSITQIISTVGFPIEMCLVMMWYIKDTSDTLVLQKLCDTMGVDREE